VWRQRQWEFFHSGACAWRRMVVGFVLVRFSASSGLPRRRGEEGEFEEAGGWLPLPQARLHFCRLRLFRACLPGRPWRRGGWHVRFVGTGVGVVPLGDSGEFSPDGDPPSGDLCSSPLSLARWVASPCSALKPARASTSSMRGSSAAVGWHLSP
jgi:hypothetical protein